MGDSRVDSILGNIPFDTVVIISLIVQIQCAPLFLHFICCLPCTGDNLTNSSHGLGVGTHHGKNTHVVQHILCRNRLRTDTAVGKSHIFFVIFIQVMAHHQHIQMLVNSVAGKWHGRIGRRWQHIFTGCCPYDIRCMTAAGTFCMVSMNRSSLEGRHSILYKSPFVQSICMDGYLHIIAVCYRQTSVNGLWSSPPVLMKFQTAGPGSYLFCQSFRIR